MTGKYAREGMAGVAVNNVMFDLGLDYRIKEVRNLRFAVTLTNFGVNVQPSGKMTVLKTNGEQEVSSFESISVPTTFRLGASIDVIQKEKQNLRLSLQLNHPSDNNETMAIGAEYFLRKMLYVRTGYEFGQDETGFPPLGLGLVFPRRFGKISVDYSLNNKTKLVIAHRLSTIEDADIIYVLDKGKIESQGKHEELISKSTIYKKLQLREQLENEF